jgi:hypothetical protein
MLGWALFVIVFVVLGVWSMVVQDWPLVLVCIVGAALSVWGALYEGWNHR